MRTASEHRFPAPDGTELFYRAWLPKGPIEKVILLFHRGHEHSGRFQLLVDGLNLEDTAFFAWDSRGSGLSPGDRGAARNLAQLEQDMQGFFEHLQAEFKVVAENTVVIAHSVAAVVAGLWALDYAPRLRALVLATPALEVKLYVPFARQGLTVLNALGQMQNVSSYVRGRALTHDREQAKLYDNDPLISKQIATNVLLDLDKGAARLLANAGSLEIPTLVMAARADWVVKNYPIRKLYRKLPHPRNEIAVYRDFYHAIFHEKDRHLVFADVRSFVLRSFEHEVDRSHLPQADRYSASAERYRWHLAGLPWLSPMRMAYKITRLSMKTLGRLSKGLRLGLKTGFSSGSTLDYVYENKKSGWTPFGKLFDWIYLDSIGWVCIRQRRKHLEQLLDGLLNELSGPVKIADFAGGPGRYLMGALQSRPQADIQVVVRDQDEQGLAEGREAAARAGEQRIRYEKADAFSPTQVAQAGPLDIGVVSGLWELFPENAPLLKCLEGLSQAIRPGGYLIYTNQPSHPQIELIAETLTHQDGSRWVMRCRSTAEIDELVRQAGFTKRRMLIDDHGIFSVSVAQRNLP